MSTLDLDKEIVKAIDKYNPQDCLTPDECVEFTQAEAILESTEYTDALKYFEDLGLCDIYTIRENVNAIRENPDPHGVIAKHIRMTEMLERGRTATDTYRILHRKAAMQFGYDMRAHASELNAAGRKAARAIIRTKARALEERGVSLEDAKRLDAENTAAGLMYGDLGWMDLGFKPRPPEAAYNVLECMSDAAIADAIRTQLAHILYGLEAASKGDDAMPPTRVDALWAFDPPEGPEYQAWLAELVPQKWRIARQHPKKRVANVQIPMPAPNGMVFAVCNPDIFQMLRMHGKPIRYEESEKNTRALYPDTENVVAVLPTDMSIIPDDLLTITLTENRLLWYMLTLLAQSNADRYRTVSPDNVNAVVVISISEYAQLTKTSTVRYTRKQIYTDARKLSLRKIRLMHDSYVKDGKEYKPVKRQVGFVSIVGTYAELDDDHVLISIDPVFAAWMVNSYMLKYPMKELFELDINKNQNACSLFLHILNYVHMQTQEPKPFVVLSVTTLAGYCPTIPSEATMTPRQKRDKTRTVWKPLEKALNELQNLLAWELCQAKGKPLTAEQKGKETWRTVKNLYVKITLKSEYDPRIK